MANVPDDRAVSSLTKEVAAAVDTLKILTGAKASHLVGKSQRLPVEEITLAAGVAFLQTTKAGLIICGVTGHGFLLKKLPSSPSGWSAPLFIDIKSAGVGISAGISKSENILILDTEHAVQSFLHTQVSLDSEVSIASGPAGRRMHSSELNMSHPGDTFSGAMYSVAHGAMVDVSFQGVKASVKEAAMKKLYGPNVTSAEVLSGAVPQQPCVEPLIAELQIMARQGAVQNTAPTSTHF